MTRLLLPLTLLLALALVPASANASDTQESIFEDEYLTLDQGSATRNAALNTMAELGADTIRSLVRWRDLAPRSDDNSRPKGLDFTNPQAYDPGYWDRYDDLVRGAQARGLQVLFSPSSPLPDWASDCRGRRDNRRSCRPRVSYFREFVQALGNRYSGTYADENQGGGVLPRVGRWSIWNEPNQPGWLTPQFAVVRGVKVPVAAHHYRRLAESAIAGLKRSGHGADQILLAETAPIGRTSGSLARRPIPPADFIREMFCLSKSGRKLTGTAASIRKCSGYRRLAVTGFAHHPYTRGGSQPPLSKPLPGEITIGNVSLLKRILAQGASARRIPRNLPIFYTEFGYQTDPPDRLFGVTLDEQAEFINQSDYIAYRDKRIQSVSQYKLIDEAAISSFQTGLRFVDGNPKPAFDAYKLPIYVVRRSSGVRVYGQVRPAADGSSQSVTLERAEGSGAPFATVQTIAVTSAKGHFVVDVPTSGGRWRLRWNGITSREASPARR